MEQNNNVVSNPEVETNSENVIVDNNENEVNNDSINVENANESENITINDENNSVENKETSTEEVLTTEEISIDSKKKKKVKIEFTRTKGIKGMYNYMITRDTKDLIFLLIRLLIIVGIIYVLHYPIELFKEMLVSFITIFNISVPDSVLKMIYLIFDFGYGIFGLLLFYMIVSTRYDNLLKSFEKQTED